DIFVVKVAAITKGKGIGGQESLVRSDHSQTRRRLEPVINGLALDLAPKTFKANLRGVSLHQFVITYRLLIGNFGPVLVFFLPVGAAGVDVHRIFRELKNIRSQKTD